MKTNFLKISFAFVLLTALYSCNDEKLKPAGDKEVVDQTKQLAVNKNVLDKMAFGLFGADFRANAGGRTSEGKHRFSGLFKSKDEAARTANIWDTCALVTITENSDGTFTVILNFGEGCEENGKFIQGVVAFTGSETDTSGHFQIAFQDFAERDINVEEEYPFTVSGVYQGGWVVNPNPEFDYAEAFEGAFEINYESGAQLLLAGEGELAGNENGIVVTKHNVHGSDSDGNTFGSAVVNPLVFDFNCELAYIYVAGTEVYQYNGEAAAVDYGNGVCDNILTIQQEGLIIIIDLDEVNG